ncbi:MAG: S9 family peptidase [Phycisphaerales bacterium]
MSMRKMLYPRGPIATLSIAMTAAFTNVVSAAAQQHHDQPIVTSDLLQLRTVTHIDVSTDGERAVYAVKSIAQAKPADIDDDGEVVPPKYEYRSHLFLIDLLQADAQPVQLTFGRRNDVSPQFLPDGGSIVFVRSPMKDDDDAPSAKSRAAKKDPAKNPQLWRLSLSGGEARAVTAFEFGVSDPVVAPGGDGVVVQSKVEFDELPGLPPWPIERPQRAWGDHIVALADDADPEVEAPEARPDGDRAQIRAWLEQNAEREAPAVVNRLEFQDETSLRERYGFTQLFLVPLDRESAIARSDATQLTASFNDHADAAFSAKGNRILYTARKPLTQHIDREIGQDIWQCTRDGSEHQLLLAHEGWSFSSPRVSLDGSVLAFVASQTDEPNYRQSQLGMVSISNAVFEQIIWLTDAINDDVIDFRWASARGALIYTQSQSGGFPLKQISPGLLKPRVISDESAGVHALGAGGGSVVFAHTSPRNPCVLMVETARGTHILHDMNEWVQSKRLSVPQPDTIERPDGTKVQMWIIPPAGLEPGQSYPLVLAIHGGPSAMWGPGELSMWHEFQLLASWGFGVVYCNPRGSGGYGYDFQEANHQNWGAGPSGDVLAAVDRALNQPWVDRNRLLVTGGSYAGYLTAWIIANDHRFKAAVAQRGVYDLSTFFGEGNAWRLVEWAMGGYPWQSQTRAVLQRESPFTYVHRMQTPLLIMHSSNDLRTGVSQSEMLYRALKVLEMPVEYVRYPGEGHELSRSGDPLLRMDRLNRIIEFFERFVQNDRPAPVATSEPAPAEEESEGEDVSPADDDEADSDG